MCKLRGSSRSLNHRSALESLSCGRGQVLSGLGGYSSVLCGRIAIPEPCLKMPIIHATGIHLGGCQIVQIALTGWRNCPASSFVRSVVLWSARKNGQHMQLLVFWVDCREIVCCRDYGSCAAVPGPGDASVKLTMSDRFLTRPIFSGCFLC
jgi:hypothetical protein